MTTNQDIGLTIAKESTWGTYVAGVRGHEPIGDAFTGEYNKGVVQGEGMRVGSRFPRLARRVVTSRDGTVTVPIEVLSKGMGYFLEACLGASVITVVSGSTYQHNFTVGDTPPSLSIQEQLVEAGGTVDDYSWVGCMCDSVEFALSNRGLLKATAVFDARDLSTAQSHVAPAYPSSPNLFHHQNWSVSTGTFTGASTTALPSCATGTVNVRDLTIKLDRGLTKDRFNAGQSGLKSKQLVGQPDVTGTITVEYDSTTWRDLVLNDTTLSLTSLYTAGALSTGLESIAFALPALKIEGPLPQPNGNELIVVQKNFRAFDDLTNPAFGVYMRTADTAL